MSTLWNKSGCLIALICLLGSDFAFSAKPVSLNLLAHTHFSEPLSEPNPNDKDWLRQHPAIRVGVSASAHPPYQVSIADEDFEGITADYLELLSRTLGVDFQVFRYPDSSAALSALNASQVEMIVDDRFLTDTERHPDLLLTDRYLSDRAVLVSQKPVRETDGLRGKVLFYIGGHALREQLRNAFPKASLTAATDDYRAMASVANDDKAVFWTNVVTAAEINRQNFNSQLMLSPSSVLSEQGPRFIIRPDMRPLKDAINSVLRDRRQNIYNEIAQTWDLMSLPEEKKDTLKHALTSEERNWIAHHPKIAVYVVNTHVPVTYINDGGQQSGYAVSLLQNIAKETGLTFSWVPLSNVPEMRDALKSAPDSLIAAADASATHEPGIIYSRPYQISNWMLVTRSAFPAIRSLSDMKGKRVAVFTGIYYLPELRERFPQVEFVEDDFSLETALSLFTHRLDGVIVPQTAASFILKSYLSDRFRIALTLPIAPLRLAMATSEENKVLISIINKTLSEQTSSEMSAELTGWQMRYALERFEVWGRYRTAILIASAVMFVIAVMLAFYFWRNRWLKKNLAIQQALQNELTVAKQQVEKASESKSVFLSQMSHEIRTPLNAIIGLLELEHLGHSSPAQRRNNIAVAYESSKFLLMLVGDILDMAKIESGTYAVRSVPVSLNAIVNQVSTLFHHTAEKKGLTLLTQVDVEVDRVMSDPLMLSQIASNLLSNAIKFTAHGEVEIVIYQTPSPPERGNSYVLEVSDSGPGLTEAQQAAIFEPFVQVHSAQSARQGTGLGLTICRQLAELLNGQLAVESVPGEGTTFIFRFSAPAVIDEADMPPDTNVGAISTPCKILVVDDHAPSRMLLSQQLTVAGHTCVVAEDGVQALQLWGEETQPFDMVITDCNMPGMSGFELIRQLREKEKQLNRAPGPMLGLTAMAEQKVVVLAEEAGMTACLFKPVELARLLEHIPVTTRMASPSGERHTRLGLREMAQSQPEIFDRLIDAAISQNAQDCAAFKQGIADADFTAIRRAAHSLTGGARLLEAHELAGICERLENAAEEEDLPHILSLVTALEAHLLQLNNRLKDQQFSHQGKKADDE
ncbi:TPA: ATP-binding protein [Enterobacter bugandensis]